MCGGGLATKLASESTWGLDLPKCYLKVGYVPRQARIARKRLRHRPKKEMIEGLANIVSPKTTTFPNRRVRPELWPTMGSKPLQSLAGWTVVRSWQWT
ncbi:hypothetical protein MGG_14619 [Pyricularia oryzae 70-15]|uniref:Uncharacterized protein n=1 Tax=Pyricularia oryzae (strain 70-15 / ATCC MYA-4617 / FGSC 8958) TaxID=242507 RepID=G4MMC6_PYRO7